MPVAWQSHHRKLFYPFNKKYHKEGVGVLVITNAQLLSTKPKHSFCAGSNPAQCVRDSRWWGSLTIVAAGNIAKCLSSVNSTISQKQFFITIIIIIIINIIISYGISTESFLKSHFLVKLWKYMISRLSWWSQSKMR